MWFGMTYLKKLWGYASYDSGDAISPLMDTCTTDRQEGLVYSKCFLVLPPQSTPWVTRHHLWWVTDSDLNLAQSQQSKQYGNLKVCRIGLGFDQSVKANQLHTERVIQTGKQQKLHLAFVYNIKCRSCHPAVIKIKGNGMGYEFNRIIL